MCKIYDRRKKRKRYRNKRYRNDLLYDIQLAKDFLGKDVVDFMERAAKEEEIKIKMCEDLANIEKIINDLKERLKNLVPIYFLT